MFLHAREKSKLFLKSTGRELLESIFLFSGPLKFTRLASGNSEECADVITLLCLQFTLSIHGYLVNAWYMLQTEYKHYFILTIFFAQIAKSEILFLSLVIRFISPISCVKIPVYINMYVLCMLPLYKICI